MTTRRRRFDHVRTDVQGAPSPRARTLVLVCPARLVRYGRRGLLDLQCIHDTRVERPPGQARASSLAVWPRRLGEPPRPPDLTPERERLLELGLDLRPRLRAPALVQHRAQDAVDSEPGMPEAGVGLGHLPPAAAAPRAPVPLARLRGDPVPLTQPAVPPGAPPVAPTRRPAPRQRR